MPDITNLSPMPNIDINSGNALQQLYDSFLRTRKDLEFFLQNLDDENIASLDASVIRSGYISADRISGGILSGVSINITDNCTVGNNLYIGGPNGIRLWYQNVLGTETFSIWCGGNMAIMFWEDYMEIGPVGYDVDFKSDVIFQSSSSVTFECDEVHFDYNSYVSGLKMAEFADLDMNENDLINVNSISMVNSGTINMNSGSITNCAGISRSGTIAINASSNTIDMDASTFDLDGSAFYLNVNNIYLTASSSITVDGATTFQDAVTFNAAVDFNNYGASDLKLLDSLDANGYGIDNCTGMSRAGAISVSTSSGSLSLTGYNGVTLSASSGNISLSTSSSSNTISIAGYGGVTLSTSSGRIVLSPYSSSGVQLNGYLAFFGGSPVAKTSVSDPSTISTGSAPSSWSQSWGGYVKTDLDNLRNTLYNLINALQSYSLV